MQKLAARFEIPKVVDQASVNLVGALNAPLPFHAADGRSFLQRGRHNEWIPLLDLQLCRYSALLMQMERSKKGMNLYTGANCKANRIAEKKRLKEASIPNSHLGDPISCSSSFFQPVLQTSTWFGLCLHDCFKRPGPV
jgi:hypothetical protein